MGKPSPPKPALLFTGILHPQGDYLFRAKEILLNQFGPVARETAPVLWNRSDYYREELGWPIMRTFLFFERQINPEDIVDIKLRTNEIEDNLSSRGKRKINIDPGYLTHYNVVLATTKNYSHRIYLGKGIYGEVTLLYKDKTFVPNIFTYPDYQEQSCIEMFLKAREFFKHRL